MTDELRRAVVLVLLGVLSRREGAGPGHLESVDRALGYVAAVLAMMRHAALLGALSVVGHAREPYAWPEVRAAWGELCDAAEAAHDAEGWRGAVNRLRAARELELSRLWGAALPGTGAVP